MNSAEEVIHFPITPLLSTHMHELVRKIEPANVSGNLDGLFAYHVIGNEPDFPLTWNVNCATEEWLAKNSESLSHFHVLAAAGYALRHFGHSAPSALRKAFTNGLAKLRPRDPFPDDRVSFAYQPRAFLGIALGVTTLDESSEAYRSWLMELLADQRCSNSMPYHALLYNYIRYVLTRETIPIGDVKHYTNLQELALLEWSTRHKVVRLLDPHMELSRLQAQILRTFLVGDTSVFDSSQAAVIWSAVHASLARSVEQLVLSRNHVSMILRRFEAALRRWRWDDSSKMKRPITWPNACTQPPQAISRNGVSNIPSRYQNGRSHDVRPGSAAPDALCSPIARARCAAYWSCLPRARAVWVIECSDSTASGTARALPSAGGVIAVGGLVAPPANEAECPGLRLAGSVAQPPLVEAL